MRQAGRHRLATRRICSWPVIHFRQRHSSHPGTKTPTLGPARAHLVTADRPRLFETRRLHASLSHFLRCLAVDENLPPLAGVKVSDRAVLIREPDVSTATL